MNWSSMNWKESWSAPAGWHSRNRSAAASDLPAAFAACPESGLGPE